MLFKKARVSTVQNIGRLPSKQQARPSRDKRHLSVVHSPAFVSLNGFHMACCMLRDMSFNSLYIFGYATERQQFSKQTT